MWNGVNKGNGTERQAGARLWRLQGPGKVLRFCSDCSVALMKDVEQSNDIIYFMYMFLKNHFGCCMKNGS